MRLARVWSISLSVTGWAPSRRTRNMWWGPPSPSGRQNYPRYLLLSPGVGWDQAPYWMLTASAVRWTDIAPFERDNVIVVLGQGLVGSLILQVMRSIDAGRLVAVDAAPLRCELAAALGADYVINAADEDPVSAVRRLSDGIGAELVVYAVGGPAGPRAFEQGMEMLAEGGTLHLIGKYEHQYLPLSSGTIQGRRILGGYFGGQWHTGSARRALALIESGAIDTHRMTTHRFPYTRAPEAFHLLHDHTDQTLGVLLDWDIEEN